MAKGKGKGESLISQQMQKTLSGSALCMIVYFGAHPPPPFLSLCRREKKKLLHPPFMHMIIPYSGKSFTRGEREGRGERAYEVICRVGQKLLSSRMHASTVWPWAGIDMHGAVSA